MKPENRLYLARLATGIAMGVASAYLSLSVVWVAIILLTALVYALTVFVYPPIFKVGSSSPSKRAIALNGIGAYIIFWLTTWIFSFNILFT